MFNPHPQPFSLPGRRESTSLSLEGRGIEGEGSIAQTLCSTLIPSPSPSQGEGSPLPSPWEGEGLRVRVALRKRDVQPSSPALLRPREKGVHFPLPGRERD